MDSTEYIGAFQDIKHIKQSHNIHFGNRNVLDRMSKSVSLKIIVKMRLSASLFS